MKDTAKAGNIPGIGDAAPAFSLSDSKRQTVSLSGILENETALLVFFRGYWWPFCRRQLTELESRKQELRDYRVRAVAISVDSPADLHRLKQDLNLSLTLLSDAERETVKAYDILNTKERNGIAYPSIFVVNREGVVVFRSLDRRETRTKLDSLFAFLSEFHKNPTKREENTLRSFVLPRPRDFFVFLKEMLFGKDD